jgi:hypothetical protein
MRPTVTADNSTNNQNAAFAAAAKDGLPSAALRKKMEDLQEASAPVVD